MEPQLRCQLEQPVAGHNAAGLPAQGLQRWRIRRKNRCLICTSRAEATQTHPTGSPCPRWVAWNWVSTGSLHWQPGLAPSPVGVRSKGEGHQRGRRTGSVTLVLAVGPVPSAKRIVLSRARRSGVIAKAAAAVGASRTSTAARTVPVGAMGERYAGNGRISCQMVA